MFILNKTEPTRMQIRKNSTFLPYRERLQGTTAY